MYQQVEASEEWGPGLLATAHILSSFGKSTGQRSWAGSAAPTMACAVEWSDARA